MKQIAQYFLDGESPTLKRTCIISLDMTFRFKFLWLSQNKTLI